uniref:Ubiquitin-like domain-containing protein n=1 Tax=Acrobeloides nanus TaxID=290746 RepID=A0A914DW22_9BILA
MDLHFEIINKKRHILCDARETATPIELKRIIEGILHISSEKQILKKPVNESRDEWVVLDDRSALSDLGFNTKNARPDEPAVLALLLPEDDGNVNIAEMSSPPPLPEAMRHRDMDNQE